MDRVLDALQGTGVLHHPHHLARVVVHGHAHHPRLVVLALDGTRYHLPFPEGLFVQAGVGDPEGFGGPVPVHDVAVGFQGYPAELVRARGEDLAVATLQQVLRRVPGFLGEQFVLLVDERSGEAEDGDHPEKEEG